MDGKIGSKDHSSLVGQSHKHVTPYKVAVVCLVHQMCILRYKIRPNAYLSKGERGITIKPQHLRSFYLLSLKLIHCPDLAFVELNTLVTGPKYQLMPDLIEAYNQMIDKVLVKKVDYLLDSIIGLNKLLIDLPGQVSPLCHKSSPMGLFLRRMMLHLDKLSFSQTIQVYDAFERYVREGRDQLEKEANKMNDKLIQQKISFESPCTTPGSTLENNSGMDISEDKAEEDMDVSEDDSTSQNPTEVFKLPQPKKIPTLLQKSFSKTLPTLGHIPLPDSRKVEEWDSGAIWSRKQAELFISQQAMYLLNNPQQALPPPLLQERLKLILKHNPEHAEAYYLSFLNCLRVNEFCGALESLYHYFDRTNTLLNPDDKPKGLRFAALNLGILYAHFGFKEEALRALKEAIALAHEVSDNQCLQHIQAWYYKLIGNEKMLDKQMERSILKSSDLNLHFLTSLGLLSFSRFASSMGTKPSLVFELLHKSDLLNFHYGITDLMANSYATKAALWNMYGKTDMASLMSQMLLHLDLKDPTIGLWCYNGESVCLALCNVANRFIEEGEFNLADLVLTHARERFPREKSWQMCEQLMKYTQALYQRKWFEAQKAVEQIATHDKIESELRKTELLIERENYRDAMEVINAMFDQENDRMAALHRIRAMILAGKATMCESNKCERMPIILKYGKEKPVERSTCSGSAAVNHFMKAVTTASEFYLNYYACMGTIEHAKLLFDKGFTTQALRLMEEAIVILLAHGTAYDQATSLYFYLVCKANDIQTNVSGQKRIDSLLEIIKTLERVKDTFKRLGVMNRVKTVVFLQAMLSEDTSNQTDLLKFSLEFRKLDELDQ